MYFKRIPIGKDFVVNGALYRKRNIGGFVFGAKLDDNRQEFGRTLFDPNQWTNEPIEDVLSEQDVLELVQS